MNYLRSQHLWMLDLSIPNHLIAVLVLHLRPTPAQARRHVCHPRTLFQHPTHVGNAFSFSSVDSRSNVPV
ncbi:hypothetical protein BV20DRAFT_686480 [Pilatotrama ljubarskyi]|nr:hypothetical protein BV20DRAFT_686480 [Pilatotrama ljubarskyi]